MIADNEHQFDGSANTARSIAEIYSVYNMALAIKFDNKIM